MWRRRYSNRGAFLKFFGVLAVILAIPAGTLIFLVALGLGILLLPNASPNQVLLAWAFLCFTFFVVKFAGVVFSMQRDEDLPLQNLLHLPISLHQVFLLNFLGKQLNVSNYVFLPAFLGLAIACSFSLHPSNSVWVVTAFTIVLFVGAGVYLLENWIVATFTNKRHRTFLVYGVMLGFVILMQTPNLYIALEDQRSSKNQPVEQVSDPSHDSTIANQVDREQLSAESQQYQHTQDRFQDRWVVTSESNASNFPWYTLALTVALFVFAALFLWRGYRTTLIRFRKGQSKQARKNDRKFVKSKSEVNRPTIPANLPSAIAVVTLRQWFRSIQGKMVIVAPIFIIFAFGVLWLRYPNLLSSDIAPLLVIGFVTLLGSPSSLTGNLFAFDGLGFRLYLQAGISLRTMLLGKCIAISVTFGTFGVLMLILFSVVFTISPSHTIATVFQGIVAFFASCCISIWLSVRFPFAISHTTISTSGTTALGLFVFFVHLAMIAFVVFLAWCGLAIEESAMNSGLNMPVYLFYSLVECLLAWIVFRTSLSRFANTVFTQSSKILATIGEQP